MSSIGVSGGTTVYIRQIGSDIQFSTNELIWTTFTFPCTMLNTDTSGGNVIVAFSTDITLTSANDYFVCGSTNLQFGSSSLKNDGTRPKITIDGVTNYLGLIQNGTSSSNGYSLMKIQNLEVLAVNGSTLYSATANSAGWIGQSYFARGAGGNFITNCSSDGDIPSYCGGIVGALPAYESGAFLSISVCNSTGSIGSMAGGILGISAGASSGNVLCQSCWSSGSIDSGGGGIAGNGVQIATIQNCYSTGAIGQQAGGICGQGAGRSATVLVYVLNCYSTGNISFQGGGIIGNLSGVITVANCYSTGNIANSQGGGICGVTNVGGQTISGCYATGTQSSGTGYIIGSQTVVNGTFTIGSVTSTLTNNYSEPANSSSGWNDTNAKSVLAGDPMTTPYGTTWIQPNGLNTPFLLTNSGYTPYSLSLVKIYSETIDQGNSTSSGIVSGYTYSILSINDSLPSVYPTISINSATGAISTTSSTQARNYRIYVYSTKNPYSVTEYFLVVNGSTPPVPPTPKKKKKPLILFNNIAGTTTIIKCKTCKPITIRWCL
jgi:hypothetical protein